MTPEPPDDDGPEPELPEGALPEDELAELASKDELTALDPSLAPELLDTDGLPPLKHEWRVFAMSYVDPTSPTFGKKIESYLNAYPGVSRKSAARRAYVLLATPAVREEMARIQLHSIAAVGLTKEQYLRYCMSRARVLFDRGGRGDATAAATLMKLVGQAAGFLVHRTEDLTPPERRQLSGEGLAQAVFEAADRWRRLRESPPVRELPPGPPPEDYVPPPGRCWHCRGQRAAIYSQHFSGKPTCRECDYRLNDERRAHVIEEARELQRRREEAS